MILASKMAHAVATYILSLAIKGKKILKKLDQIQSKK
jgi:hypothetical protein